MIGLSEVFVGIVSAAVPSQINVYNVYFASTDICSLRYARMSRRVYLSFDKVNRRKFMLLFFKQLRECLV